MLKKWCLLAGLTLLVSAAFAADHGMLNFEEEAILSQIRAEAGKVSLSDRHYLGGKRSLRWDYKPGDVLTIDFPPWYLSDAEATKLFGTEARTILTLNVYNEKPLADKPVRVSFGRRGEKKDDCGFDFFLNFKGWRASWPVYSRDMEGAPRGDMDRIRMQIPEGVPAGTLYLDNLIPGSVTYERYQDADLQNPVIRMRVPYSRPFSTAMPILTWQMRPKDGKELTDADRQGFASIRKNMLTLLNLKPPRSFARDLRSLRKLVAKFELVRHPDGRVTGKPIRFGVMDRQYTYVPEKEKVLADFVPHRQFGSAMLWAAKLYQIAPNDLYRAELLKMYFLLLDHNLDQGFAWGSGVGTRANVGYGSREFFYSLLVMADVLKQHGRSREASDIGVWHGDVKSFLDPQYYEIANADAFNIKWRSALIAILLMDDTPEKAAYMRAFSRYIAWALQPTSGWLGGLKADGCSFHHWGHYPSYSMGFLQGAAWLSSVLHGTPWELESQVKSALVHTVVSFIRQGNPAMPPSLEGRVPFRGLRNVGPREAFKLLSETDPALKNKYPEIAAGKCPEGFASFNYGGFGVHRFGEKMLILKTFNRYVWGSEIYQAQNRYGRYWSYGSMFLLGTETAAGEGLSAAGWDWNRVPGATTRILPWKELVSPILHHEMRTLPGNRSNGCSHLEDMYGVFGSVVTEPDRKPHYDPAFRVTSSIFTFGPRIVALGSGISSGTDRPVETTLFQLGTDKGKRPSYFQSPEPLTGSDTDLVQTPGKGKVVWTADWRDNVWFIFGDRPVRFRRSLQKSPLHTGVKGKTASGDFTVASIEHGVKPVSGRYEYLLRLDLKAADAPAEAEKLASRKPYTVLQQDDAAHVVRDHASGVTAAAVFQPVKNRNWGGVIAAADKPCYILFRNPAEKELILSLNTADLAGFIPRGTMDLDAVEMQESEENQARTVTIHLPGVWEAAGSVDARAEVKSANGMTAISGKFRHGKPIQLHLRKK